MRLNLIGVVLLMAWGGMAVEILPSFREANLPVARREELRRALPAEYASAKARLTVARARWMADCSDAVGFFPHERVVTRAGIADRLAGLVTRDLAAGDASSLAFAELELEDLKKFADYFALECAAWQTSPERPANRPQIVEAAAFGLVGDGVADDGPALRRAVAAIRALRGAPSILRIPAGTFYLGSCDRNNANLDLSALSNCVVTGVSPEKTHLRFGVYDARGLFATRAYNTTFRNFEIKWQITPFFQGTILDANREEGWFEMDHDPGSLAPDDPKFQVRKHRLGLHTYMPDGTFIKSHLLFWNRQVEKRANGRYRLSFDTTMNSWSYAGLPQKGAKGVLPDRLSGFEAFGLVGCTLCTVEGVWIRNGREAFLQPSGGFWCSAVRCRIFPDAGFVFSTNADGFYNARGSWISDCEFRNMGDDGCNSVMHGAQISRAAGNALWCKPYTPWPKPGDLWQLVESTTGEYLANARVADCADDTWQGQAQWKVTFAEALPADLNTYETMGRGEITAQERREIAHGNLKLKRPPDLVFAPEAFGVGYVVKNNRFTGLRNTAMVVQCPNALLEGNRAEGMQNGMCLGMLLNWNEGPAPYNVTVRGNTFTNVWYGIFTSLAMHNGAPPKTQPVRDLVIEGNVFGGIGYQALNLTGAEKPVLRDNRVALGPPTRHACRRSVLESGNAARLEAVFAKAARGEPITVAALGGSITAGAGAGGAVNRWSDHVADWFVRAFPQAKVTRVNAGIGATGSRLGAHRIVTDVVPARPDFVTIDFSVNDHVGEQAGETLEGCVRQILRLPSTPAVMLVSFLTQRGTNVQDEHRPVARHYGLPQISVREAIWPRIERGEIAWRDYSDDAVHPNRAGHPYAAALVTDYLDKALAAWRAGRRTPPAAFPAKPLHGTSYDQGMKVMPQELRVKENKGFAAGPRRSCWPSVFAATKPGDRLVFETDAKTLAIVYWRLHADYGRARVTVDGEEMAELEGWFDLTWGGYAHVREIYRDKPGHHVVSLEVLPTHDPASKGHRFELCTVLEQR